MRKDQQAKRDHPEPQYGQKSKNSAYDERNAKKRSGKAALREAETPFTHMQLLSRAGKFMVVFTVFRCHVRPCIGVKNLSRYAGMISSIWVVTVFVQDTRTFLTKSVGNGEAVLL